MKRLSDDQATEILARVICMLVGIQPVSPIDGSSDWFMFANDAKSVLDSLKERGFTWAEDPKGKP